MVGSACFVLARGVNSIEMVSVTVPLVTAITNCSAMEPEAYLQPPWLRYSSTVMVERASMM